ncbi:MAG: PorT family protein [Saprospiraceae bacterium]|nr:PorT family protein [Saprospiraceae bacterium]HRD81951.1 porin family protein [Saprospiraceae bacterium]HRJ14401.1 porin family protein [Saprospiraceae bacterium]
MKRKIAISAAFILTMIISGFAQNDVRFGFQVSPTVNWMSTNNNRINSSGTNLGLKLGMTGDIYFRENYAVSTGLGFWFNAGGTLLHEYGGIYWDPALLPPGIDTMPNMVKLKYGIQFVEIPIGLKMRTKEFGYNRYYIEPALTLGFKTQARGTATGNGLGEEVEKINIRNEVNPLNLSWGIGGGIERSISENTSLILGVAFQIGFADLTRNRGQAFVPNRTEPVREDSQGKVSGIILRAGIIF